MNGFFLKSAAPLIIISLFYFLHSKKNLLKVQEIRYDIDDFIENSDQPDYSINTELFDELELDKYDSSASKKFGFGVVKQESLSIVTGVNSYALT